MSGSNKTLIIGIDGLDRVFIKKYREFLPTLHHLLSTYYSSDLESTIPPLTSPAWVSSYTGVNPGKHSIFNFIDIDPRNRKIKICTSNDIKAKPFWKYLDELGFFSIIINAPLTWPVKPFRGVMIAGTPASEDMNNIVYPKEVKMLTNSMYKEYVDAVRKAVEDDPELDISKIIHKINHWIRKRSKSKDKDRPSPKPTENPEMDKPMENSGMDKADNLLNKMEGFADAIPSKVKGKNLQDLWIPLAKGFGRLEDNKGRQVPTGTSLALNIAGMSGSFVELGVIERGEIGDTYTVSVRDLQSSGVLLK